MPTANSAAASKSALGNKEAVPNLVQGVSQQSVTQRRNTQCELEENVFNSSVDGAMARNGFHLLKNHESLDLSGAAFFETYYGSDEAYLLAVSGGEVYAFDLEDGTACTITEISSAYSDDYLDVATAGTEGKKVKAVTQGSTTFLLNREVPPAMDSGSASPALPTSEALVFVKAGDYNNAYSIRLTNLNTAVVTTKTATTVRTIDTTAQRFVRPSAIALFLAYGNTGATGGTYDPWATSAIVFADLALGWGPVAGINGTDGYSASVVGSTIRIWRADGAPFTIETNDDNSDEFMWAVYGEIESFDRLPRMGHNGYTVKVRGENNSEDDDYYLQFSDFAQNNRGSWVEVVGPGILTELDEETMPHLLVNTGYRTFEYKVGTWSTRIAGDESTAPIPSFVGKPPRNLFWDNQRLGFMSQTTIVWSKSKYPYTFFKDTVQTILATDPVDTDIAAPSKGIRGGTSPLDFALQVDETVFLWSQYSQWRVGTVNSEAFKEDTVEIKPSSSYEYNTDCVPMVVGQMALLASDVPPWTAVRLLQFQQGRVAGDTDITSHVPEYILGRATSISASATLRAAFVITEEDPTSLYLWNWLIGGGEGGGTEFLQSAWSRWFLEGSSILWSGIIGSKLKVAVQNDLSGFQLLEVPLSSRVVDEDVADATYLTRLDYRVPTWDDGVCPEQATFSTYTSGYSEFTVPPAIVGAGVSTGDHTKILFVVAESSGSFTRGQTFECYQIPGTPYDTVRFLTPASLSGIKGYIGTRIVSQRDESEFFLRGQDGLVEVDHLTLNGFLVRCDRSLYTRVVVDRVSGGSRPSRVKEVDKVAAGVMSPTSFKVHTAISKLSSEVRVSIINDSPYPSYWQSALWRYSATGIHGAE